MKLVSSKQKKLVINNCSAVPEWRSSNKKIAAVKATDDPCTVLIKGKRAGKAVITVKAGDRTLRCKVTVKYKPKLSLKKKTLKAGTRLELEVTGTVSKPVWTSSDPAVASVKKSGSRKAVVKQSITASPSLRRRSTKRALPAGSGSREAPTRTTLSGDPGRPGITMSILRGTRCRIPRSRWRSALSCPVPLHRRRRGKSCWHVSEGCAPTPTRGSRIRRALL